MFHNDDRDEVTELDDPCDACRRRPAARPGLCVECLADEEGARALEREAMPPYAPRPCMNCERGTCAVGVACDQCIDDYNATDEHPPGFPGYRG